MASDERIGMCVRKSAELESLLERMFGAQGKGLHEKLTSVQGELDEATVRRIRWIATIRNRMVHEGDFAFDGTDDYLSACAEVAAALEALPARAAEAARERISRVLRSRYGAAHADPQDRLDHARARIPAELAAMADRVFALARGEGFDGYASLAACKAFLDAAAARFEAHDPEGAPGSSDTAAPAGAPLPAAGRGTAPPRRNFPVIMLLFVLAVGGAGYAGLSLGQWHMERAAARARMQADENRKNLRASEAELAQARKVLEALRAERDALTARLDTASRQLTELSTAQAAAGDPAQSRKGAASRSPREDAPTQAAPAGGTRLGFAVTDAALDRSKASLEAARQDLDANFLGGLQRHTRVTLGKPELRDKGTTIDIVVPVSWTLQSKLPQQTLGKYLRYGSGSGFESPAITTVPEYGNREDRAKTVISEQLYDHLKHRKVVIVVEAGKATGQVTIAAYSDSGFDRGFQFIPASTPRANKLSYSDQNPVVIAGIPKADATDIRDITARIEVR